MSFLELIQNILGILIGSGLGILVGVVISAILNFLWDRILELYDCVKGNK
jgi:tetrahydromethanopterin S-methyltransferase subunit G